LTNSARRSLWSNRTLARWGHREDVSTHVLGSSVEALLRLQGLGSTSVLARVIAVWPQIVGDRMNAHARPLRIDGSELVVAVDQPAWATELRMQNSRIISGLEIELNQPVINRLKVYVRGPSDLD